MDIKHTTWTRKKYLDGDINLHTYLASLYCDAELVLLGATIPDAASSNEDGRLFYFWDDGDNHCSIDFYDGLLECFYTIRSEARKTWYDEVKYFESLPEGFTKFITVFTKGKSDSGKY